MTLPQVTLKDVSRVVTGKTPSRKREDYFGGSIPFVTPTELGDSTYIDSAPQTLSDKGAAQIKLVPRNSVLVSCIGILGKVGIAGKELATNQQINAVIFDDKLVDHKYGYYALGGLKPEMDARAPSTTVAIVNKSRFEALKIACPPLDTQQRIVAVLDKADAIRRQRQHAMNLAHEFRRSVFLDMFGDPATNPKKWEIGTIRDLVGEVNYGTSAKAGTTGGHEILRMGNVTYQGGWDFSDMKRIDILEKDSDKYLVKKSDLLFNRTNSKELVGKTAVYREEQPMAYAGYLVRARANNYATTEYISAYLNSAHGKQTLRAMCRSIVGMANINAQEFQNIPIATPPVELQREYCAHTTRILEFEKKLGAAISQSRKLFESLSQKAFRGEL